MGILNISILGESISIDMLEIEVAMRDRIWTKRLNSVGSPIPTALVDTGKLRDTFSIDGNKIIVQSYATYLEDKYGVIFDFTDAEIELIADKILEQLNKV